MVASALADEVSWRARAGKPPYFWMFLHPEDSPRSTLSRAVWVPRFRLETEIGIRPCLRCWFALAPSPWQPATTPSIDLRCGQSIESGRGPRQRA